MEPRKGSLRTHFVSQSRRSRSGSLAFTIVNWKTKMIPQSLLRSSIHTSTAKLWLTLSVSAVAASALLMIRHTAHPAASNNHAYGQMPVAALVRNSASPTVETPLMIDCSSGLGENWTIWMVSSASTSNIRDSTLGDTSFKAVWSAKRTGMLTIAREKRTLMYHSFDPARQTFGVAQRVDRRFANPGVSYDLHIHGNFVWSPDESKIVYAENKNLTSFDLRTGCRQTLPILSLEFENPAWSPDGSTIAFSSEGKEAFNPTGEGDGEALADIWMMHADGSNLRRLGQGSSPHWSSNGQCLLVTQGKSSGATEIGEYDLTAHNRYRTIRRCNTLFDDGHLYPAQGFDDAVYSPDGKTIAVFGASDPKKDNQSVFLIDTKGHFLRQLVGDTRFRGVGHRVKLAW